MVPSAVWYWIVAGCPFCRGLVNMMVLVISSINFQREILKTKSTLFTKHCRSTKTASRRHVFLSHSVKQIYWSNLFFPSLRYLHSLPTNSLVFPETKAKQFPFITTTLDQASNTSWSSVGLLSFSFFISLQPTSENFFSFTMEWIATRQFLSDISKLNQREPHKLRNSCTYLFNKFTAQFSQSFTIYISKFLEISNWKKSQYFYLWWM